MNTKFKSCFAYLILFLLLISCEKVYSAEEIEKNLVLVLVPDLSFQEVKWLKEKGQFPQLWKTGGMAAMNVRPDGPYSYLNNTVSLSAGVRGLGIEGWNAYSKGEFDNGTLVEERYQQWTGKLVDEGIIFHPYLHKLVDKNKETTYRADIGILGQTLKENSVHSYVIGNSDYNEEKIRYGPLLTMDQEGLTKGLLDATRKSPGSAAGVVMDVDKIFAYLSTFNDQSSFFVIEWGDLYRLYKQKDVMTDEYFSKQYELTLLNLELFMYQLLSGHYTDNLMMVSPMVHNDAYQDKERLAPFFYWQGSLGEHIFHIYSSTTRQPFIISNFDLVPTLLNSFHIDHSNDFLGKPLHIKEVNESLLERGLKSIDLMFVIFKTRNVVLSSYITILVLLLILVSVIIFLKDQKEGWKQTAKVLLVSGISSPLWLLLTPYALNYIQANIYLLLLTLLSFLTGYVLVRYVSNPIFAISVTLFVAITVDLFLGHYFMQRSYLGYDPIIGARYYGIGNEYAGIYLISSILLLENPLFRKWFLLLFISLGQIFVLSFTNLGANAGATIATAVMFGFFYYRFYVTNFQWRKLLIIFSVLVPVVIAILFFAQLNGKESHIGYAFSKLFQGDVLYITDTIKRKLEMNWKIFRFSNWTQLFVTTYFLIALYLWRGKKIVRNEVKKLIIQTGVVASLALLVFNDSGVVAAATSMFIIVCTSYYWALEN
ncbi:hypothetical protein BKP45_20870 [Anaerobacillus alkalidiazotrophicus]|uniref:Uncharacterized protein n=1 Tax=Anaerobacillus alkalidiazotrophicus TaxID=472963 RepID=A0A1S2LWP8_9BACI|nr:hypothetical protein [Anaerobacillus alkalidiazotrophicus]OIJ16949.1 hypothetical protein BKP45_20870 [Anaerobacillus alkalidiazotrophicus]